MNEGKTANQAKAQKLYGIKHSKCGVIDGGKETCGTQGGLISEWKQSMKFIVTTNGEKSAEAIVNQWLQTLAKG